jgi:hypothetical protein
MSSCQRASHPTLHSRAGLAACAVKKQDKPLLV